MAPRSAPSAGTLAPPDRCCAALGAPCSRGAASVLLWAVGAAWYGRPRSAQRQQADRLVEMVLSVPSADDLAARAVLLQVRSIGNQFERRDRPSRASTAKMHQMAMALLAALLLLCLSSAHGMHSSLRGLRQLDPSPSPAASPSPSPDKQDAPGVSVSIGWRRDCLRKCCARWLASWPSRPGATCRAAPCPLPARSAARFI